MWRRITVSFDRSEGWRLEGLEWQACGDSVQDTMNRWRTIEQAKGRPPHFNMVDHYTHAKDLMPVPDSGICMCNKEDETA
jgi:hypothetical protein